MASVSLRSKGITASVVSRGQYTLWQHDGISGSHMHRCHYRGEALQKMLRFSYTNKVTFGFLHKWFSLTVATEG